VGKIERASKNKVAFAKTIEEIVSKKGWENGGYKIPCKGPERKIRKIAEVALVMGGGQREQTQEEKKKDVGHGSREGADQGSTRSF